MTILGISLGTRSSGIAIVKNGVLLSRQMHSFSGVWSEKKVKKIMNCFRTYIEDAEVTGVMLKIPPECKQSDGQKIIIKRIEKLTKDISLHFDLTTRQEMKDRLTLRNTNDLIRYALRAYPNLGSLRKNDADGNDEYHTKLYEAVLAAHLCYTWLKAKQTTE